ncbi:MAG: zinc-binding alcohol dehydrogenase [Clostridiales bacterium]|jgi:threonine dehydrogenase-like Zn-dependent dehydrogenase|nr:zinc-binding alcohol dehydrogenase [Clostridiales bacterium]
MKIMVYEGPRVLKIREVPDYESPGPNDARIQTMYSGVSHGTEIGIYRGTAPNYTKINDGEYRLFRPARGGAWQYPIRSCDPGVWYMGYANVGRVVETGAAVTRVKAGDVVSVSAPHQSMVLQNEWGCLKLPDGCDPVIGVFWPNLMTTYNGILDTHIKLGDTVVIAGLGVLGQMLVQMATMNGAFQVIGVDVNQRRCDIALKNGATAVLNPKTTADVALEVRKMTDKRGADEVIDVSGHYASLNESIRMVAPDGIVTALGWYNGPASALNLGEEFHHNRVTLKCSHTAALAPSLANAWTQERRAENCYRLLQRLNFADLTQNVFPYEKAAEVYDRIDKGDETLIQAIFKY